MTQEAETLSTVERSFEIGVLKALSGDVGLATEYLARDANSGDYLNESAQLAFIIYTHAIANAWIPVSEFLPATSQSILVKDKSGMVAVTFFSETSRSIWLQEANYIEFWQPMPE